ncbi:MAG: hypothetical protein HLUCCO17_12295 [Saliniramus fredricksonii]|uniref:Uncharacterized protein n=2 Tax=Saliniramus fredricksonii TaxID=1653334 RepID=A0A0N8KE12_9HYPH|nr:MAG: hypothetical protein HLUCCO17_12295 [Saliniramus fredricksonii]SCC80539.1 hypothetical protein GA0071312_1552 [Saliniramus fredricksonii]
MPEATGSDFPVAPPVFHGGDLYDRHQSERITEADMTVSARYTDDRGGSAKAARAFGLGLLGTVALWSVPAAANDVVVADLAYSGAMGTYAIPRMELTDSSLTASEIEAAFAQGDPRVLFETLATLSATEVVIPRMSLSQDVADVTQEAVYEDIRIEDMREGRIAGFTAAGGEFSAQDGDQNVSGRFGAVEARMIDLPAILRYYTEAAGDGDNPFRTAYESFSISDLVMHDGEDVHFTIDGISGRAVAMRLLQEPLTETIAAITEMEDTEDPTPEEATRMLNFMADLMDSFRFEEMGVTGISIVDESDEDPVDMSIARIGFLGSPDGGFASFTLEDMRVAAEGAEITIASIGSEGFSFAPMTEGLRRLAEDPDADLSPDEIQRMMPVIGTVTLDNLTASIPPQPDAPAMDGAIGRLSVTADTPYQGVPTNLRVAIDNLAFDLPEGTGEEFVETARAFGYERLDLSGSFAARWNEAGQEIVLSDLSFSGEDIGAASLRGVIGGVGPQAFSGDEAARLMALMGASVKNLHLMVEDRGIAEILLTLQAAEMGVSPDEARQQMGMMSQMMLPAMLGGGPQAQGLAEAVGQFLENPGELEIAVESIDPAGIPIMELGTMSTPAALMERIEIDAQAR